MLAGIYLLATGFFALSALRCFWLHYIWTSGSLGLKPSGSGEGNSVSPSRGAQLRQRQYGIVDQGSGVEILGAIVNWMLIGLIDVTLASTVFESVPRLAGKTFDAIGYAALITFTIEYAARLWTAIEHPRWQRFGAIRSRLRSSETS